MGNWYNDPHFLLKYYYKQQILYKIKITKNIKITMFIYNLIYNESYLYGFIRGEQRI